MNLSKVNQNMRKSKKILNHKNFDSCQITTLNLYRPAPDKVMLTYHSYLSSEIADNSFRETLRYE